MINNEFFTLVNRDVQRLVAAAQARYEETSINDDDIYVIDVETRTVVRNQGNVRWPMFSPCPIPLAEGQAAMRGMRLKHFFQE